MICLGEVKLICICGSVRDNLLNKKLLKLAARMSRQRRASTSVMDLSKYRLPLLTGEASEARPARVEGLRNLIGSSDGFTIASLEYTGSVTPILKNTIDWISRYEQGDEQKNVFNGKFAALLSCAPGVLGGLKGLRHI